MEILTQFITLLTTPLAQDPSYHQFCDQRALFFIPHFMDVLSNGLLLWVGWKGLRTLKNMDLLKQEPVHCCWRLFFYSVLAVGLGSTYYHWSPDNLSLFIDRLPLSISFMALLAALIAERIDQKMGLRLLPILVLLGALSSTYWIYTEYQGAGDLRPYALIQYGGFLAVLSILFFGDEGEGNQYLIISLGLYALAKLMENLDCQVFAATGYWISGHTLKHVFASFATYALYRHMKAYTNRC